jgi:hypothetical protein
MHHRPLKVAFVKRGFEFGFEFLLRSVFAGWFFLERRGGFRSRGRGGLFFFVGAGGDRQSEKGGGERAKRFHRRGW